MANDYTTNPWILDTVGTAPDFPYKSTIYVDHFEWVGYTGDTDTLVLANGAGKEIWAANGAADLEEVRSGKVGAISGGVYIKSMTAGKVRVYMGQPT